jgi:hypothetical protein
MNDDTIPCHIEYIKFIYNIKINEEDDYNKNLLTCLESYYQIPMPTILEKLKKVKEEININIKL